MNDMTMWRDGAREDKISVLLVDPWDLDSVRGELTSVILSGCSITEGYYTDNRISGKVEAMDDGSWIDGSWMRIVLRCPGYGFEQELATLIPTKIAYEESKGATIVDYTLQSVLWSMSSDTQPSHFTIGKGATTTQVFNRICSAVKKTGLVLPGANNKRYTSSVVYELGDSYLSDLYDICTNADNRLSVDGHGRITMAKYVAPSRREPDWELDTSDNRTMVVSDGVSWEDSPGDVADRSIVTYKNGDTEVIGSAELGSNTRGYTIAKVHQENDMTPATSTRASELARSYLVSDSSSTTDRKVSTLYFPCHQGDIVTLIDGSSTTKNLVKTVEAHLEDMTLDLTLREV